MDILMLLTTFRETP
jgi:hypothetical protein